MENTLVGIIAFMRKAENLKNTLRSAHTSQGRQESSAEHSWRLGLLALVMGGFFEGADMLRLLQLALVHDLGEAVSGDIPAVLQDGAPDKQEQERQGLCELCADLPSPLQAQMLALWDEYEAAATPEARVIKALDKMETIAQHNQGRNPPAFDYAFNLAYGQEYMDFHPSLRQLRDMLDKETKMRAKEAGQNG